MALDETPGAWIARRDAAHVLRLTERQVDRLIRDGVLHGVKAGHKVSVSLESVEAEADRRRATVVTGAPVAVETAA